MGLRIGLTGQTGAGKTLVSDYLTQLGYPVIDADMVSRQVVGKGSPCLKDLTALFGKEILAPDGCLDRAKLGGIVFTDREKLNTLNNTIFPYIIREVDAHVKDFFDFGHEFVFMDAPTLIESGEHKRCDLVISVLADKNIRLSRVLTRDNITLEQAQARMKSQHEDEFYQEQSHYIICNNGSVDELYQCVEQVLVQIKEKSGEKR